MKIVKKLLGKIKDKVIQVFHTYSDYYERNFGNTQKSVYWLSTILLSVLIGLFYADFGVPIVMGFIIATLIGFVLINFLFLLTIISVKILLWFGVTNLVYLIPLIAILAGLIIAGCSGNLSEALSITSAILIVFILQMFVRSLWALFKNKVHTTTVILTVVSTGLSIILISVFLLQPGFEEDYIEHFLKLNQDQSIKTSDKTEILEEFDNGTYTVESLEYGMSKDAMVESTTFNMSPFVGGYDGIQGNYRKIYQRYDIKEVPLAGKIWYPVESDNCPVLFIAHGNHSFTTPSYLGYDYLGEYLASHGYVVVSVDENFCNACNFGNLSEENDGRAVLLLENIKQVKKYNYDRNLPLYKKMDYNNMAIAGHSRGGEMVAAAVLFNDYTYYPNNGNVRFYYHFNIKSVIAIAPTVNQYKPAGHDVELTDINYLLIHGANDQDVSSFMGTRQYNNISFSGKGEYFKSSLYIAGANHGQFNSRWGRYDLIAPLNQFLNVKNLMDSKEQQGIMKIYAKTFLDVTLKEKMDNKELLYDYSKYKSVLPKTVYIQNYVDSSFRCITDFEEDSNLQTATAKDATLRAYDVNRWTEEMTRYSNQMSKGERGNYALRLKWSDKKEARYEVDLGSYNASEKYLQFDILDMDDKLAEKKIYDNVDCKITLVDVNDKEATARLSDFGTIYPPLPVKLGKFQYIFHNNEYKHEFQTVRIPLDEMKVSDNFDYTSISKIEFLFNQGKSRTISLDNIGFSGK